MDKKNFLEDDEQKKKDDYRFVKEVIKKKSIRPRKFLIRLGGLVGGAVLFGLIAAGVFFSLLSVVKKDEQTTTGAVQFEEDFPEELLENGISDYGQVNSSTVKMGEGTKNEDLEQEDPKNTDVGASTAVPTENETDVSGVSGQKQPENDGTQTPIAVYSQMYEEMQKIAQEAMHFIVTVTGITDTEDWFHVQSDTTKQASGMIVAEDGQELYILTEYAAVENVERVVLTFCDGNIVDGRFQMYDPNTGLAILKVPLSDLRNITKEQIAVAQLGNSYTVSQGAAVIAIGSPMGYSNSVVYGQITSTTNTISTYDKQYNLFTTNMLGSKDGSGVIIDLQGQVISVMAQGFVENNEENIILGLPISQLKPLIERLSNEKQLPSIGIKGQTVTEEVMNQTGMPKGVYVSAVKSDSPVFYAGIRNGDIIVAYNGEIVETMAQYTEKLSNTEVGAVVAITVMRKGTDGYREFVFTVEVGSR